MLELTSAPKTTLSASPSPSSIVPPLNAVVPTTTRLLLIVVVPVEAPMLIDVASRKTLAVVTFVLKRSNEGVFELTVPPSTLILPSTSRLLLILVVPVVEPISTKVAAPAILTL